MQRTLMFALFVALPLCAQDADPTPPDGKRILGTWEVVRGTKDGMPAPKDMLDAKLTFDAERITVKASKGGEPPANYKLTPSKRPAEIDITPGRGDRMVLGIYKFDKDELTMVFSAQGGERPTKFDDEKASILVLRREKAKK